MLIFLFISAMSLISDHKLKTMVFSDQQASDDPIRCGNIVEVREENILEDFDSALQKPIFDLHANKPLVIVTKFQEETANLRNREVIDYGGPKIHAVTTMLDKFVYHRLKFLNATGKSSCHYGFSSEEFNRDLCTAGKISGNY